MTFLHSSPSNDVHQQQDTLPSSRYDSYNSSSSPFYAYPLPMNPKAPKDNESESPPKSTSNTYHMTQTGHINWQLPSGWKVAHREHDGRMYYFELATGKTSWNHPFALPDNDGVNLNGDRNRAEVETPFSASRRPDSHQCCAIFSCVVFPPLGIFALVHSIMTYRSWSRGKYGDAYDHSRQAYNFAWWAVAIFLGFVFYQYFIIGNGWNFVSNIFSFDWLK